MPLFLGVPIPASLASVLETCPTADWLKTSPTFLICYFGLCCALVFVRARAYVFFAFLRGASEFPFWRVPNTGF